jgi:putative membrane-bound dehydrogenase-like protein
MHPRLFASALTLALSLPVVVLPAGKELEGERAAAESVCPSPEEAARKMTVPQGYEVRCFAHEPMVVNPVAMTWDARGRLWVVEGYEYPDGSPFKNEAFGAEAKDDRYHPVPAVCQAKDNSLDAMRADHPKIPRDRIIILEDTDNDGVADKRTVFLEGLDMGSAILLGDGGVYVGQQPHLLHFKDNDGDDHADEWRVVLTGFGREDTHELLNSFCWGPDGWLYMTHGVFTNSRVRRPGEPLEKGFKFDAGIGRCKPLTGAFEVFADGTSNPWGCDYDARGNFFVSACVIDHFFHMAPGGIYARQGGAPENPYAYELLPSIVTHRHFRAAYAGVQIYQGGVYPEDTWGHAFIGNIHDNAVHEEVLTPVGATFKCEPRRDFLRANDGWFRPVSTQTGPDGNLWIMDWCDKYPCYQNAKANPEGVDREKGRIWRVVFSAAEDNKLTASRESREMDLRKLSKSELLKLLGHSNSWMRRMARRQLIEHLELDSRESLLEIAKSDAPVSTRLEAIWALSAISHQDYRAIEWLAKNKSDPALKAWAARLFGEGAHVGHYWLDDLADNPDPAVRLAVCVALRQKREVFLAADRGHMSMDSMGRTNHPTDLETKLLITSAKAEDRVLPFGIWMAIEPAIANDPKSWLDWLVEVAPKSQPLSQALTYKSMRRLCDTRDAKNLDLAVAFCGKIRSHDILLAHALDGLVKGQESGVIKPSGDVSKPLAAWRASANADVRHRAQELAVLWGDAAATDELLAVIASEKTDNNERLQALQTLRKVKSDAVRAGLVKLLSSSAGNMPASSASGILPENPFVAGGTPTAPATGRMPMPLVIEVIRAAGDIGGNDFIAPLTALAGSKDEGVRLAAIGALAGRPDWARKMLDAIAANKIASAGFPVSVRRQLATSSDKAIRDRAFKVLGAWKESSDDTKALIAAKRKACIEGEPDLDAGKLVFTTTCAVCHSFHGGGQKVGPDLIGSGRSNLDALLANVIDPNQIIGNGYENINVTTKDGRTVSGRLVEDAPAHVKLLAIAGAEQIVPRDQVAKLENTHQSVMPAGFGALPDDVFRNLVWYVLAPPEEGPLTKEKKVLLSQGVEGGEAAKKKPAGNSTRAIDWESVSLWNPQWKVEAPDFERTPMKLAEFHGRGNVLLMHPFTKDKPCALERKARIGADGLNKLRFFVAAHDQGDWELRVKVDGKVVRQETIGHDGERWRRIEVDLSKWAGKEVVVRLEGAANGWSHEFGYWSEVVLE